MEFRREWSDRADFAMVYLEEAHPTDGWLYDSVKHEIKQHETMEQRLKAAKVLDAECRRLGVADLPIVVDEMENLASITFGALPERLIIIRGGAPQAMPRAAGVRVKWIGGKGPEEYSVADCKKWLEIVVDPEGVTRRARDRERAAREARRKAKHGQKEEEHEY